MIWGLSISYSGKLARSQRVKSTTVVVSLLHASTTLPILVLNWLSFDVHVDKWDVLNFVFFIISFTGSSKMLHLSAATHTITVPIFDSATQNRSAQ